MLEAVRGKRTGAHKILAIEDDLIQSYANGELSGEEKPRFERLYLDDPAKSRRIQFSRCLKNWVMSGRYTRRDDLCR